MTPILRMWIHDIVLIPELVDRSVPARKNLVYCFLPEVIMFRPIVCPFEIVTPQVLRKLVFMVEKIEQLTKLVLLKVVIDPRSSYLRNVEIWFCWVLDVCEVRDSFVCEDWLSKGLIETNCFVHML